MKNQKEYSEEEKKKWYHKIDKRHRPKKSPISQGKKVAFTECHCHYCSHTAMFRVDCVPNQCPKCGSSGWLDECCEECTYYDKSGIFKDIEKAIQERYFK